jgi:hypothetical protein
MQIVRNLIWSLFRVKVRIVKERPNFGMQSSDVISIRLWVEGDRIVTFGCGAF